MVEKTRKLIRIEIIIKKLDEKISQIKKSMTELPHLMKMRLEKDYQLSSYDASGITSDKHVADYFFATLKEGAEPKQIANWILGQLFSKLNENNLSIEHSSISIWIFLEFGENPETLPVTRSSKRAPILIITSHPYIAMLAS